MLTAAARSWAQRKFDRGWSLLFEPWVGDKKQLSLHFDVAKGEQVAYLGHCEVLTSPQGVYRGSFVNPSALVDEATLESAKAVALKVARKGYWGPLTIDSFHGVLGETPVFRPLLDINARYSYGRVALGIADWLPPGWCYIWWHLYQIAGRAGALHTRTPFPPLPEIGHERLISDGLYALPLSIDPGRAMGTVVVVGSTTKRLRSRMLRLFGVEI